MHINFEAEFKQTWEIYFESLKSEAVCKHTLNLLQCAIVLTGSTGSDWSRFTQSEKELNPRGSPCIVESADVTWGNVFTAGRIVHQSNKHAVLLCRVCLYIGYLISDRLIVYCPAKTTIMELSEIAFFKCPGIIRQTQDYNNK